MIMEISVGNGHIVGSMRQVDKSIVLILVHVSVSREIDVVYPDIGRFLNGNTIPIFSQYLADLQVSDNDVLLSVDCEADAGECFT